MRSRLSNRTYLALWMGAIFVLMFQAPSHAQEAASFYKGKVVNFIVGFSPGGGYDTYSRLLATALEKRLGCTVVVRNMPGGGGLVSMNHMYNTAKKDGLALAIAPTGLPLTQAVGAKGVRFDCRKFNWIVSITRDVRCIGVAPDSPYKSVEDLKKAKTLRAAMTEVTSPAGKPFLATIAALGMENAKVVAGYPGSTEAILAVKRGEADFTVFSLFHFLKDQALMRPLAVLEEKRRPELPDVPSVAELGILEDMRKPFEIVMASEAIGRSVITPPGVPKARVDFLRKVLMDCLKDPDVLKKAERVDLDVDPVPGEEVQGNVKRALDVSPEEIKKVKYILFEKYL